MKTSDTSLVDQVEPVDRAEAWVLIASHALEHAQWEYRRLARH